MQYLICHRLRINPVLVPCASKRFMSDFYRQSVECNTVTLIFFHADPSTSKESRFDITEGGLYCAQ